MRDRDVHPNPTELRHRIGPRGTFTLHAIAGSVEIHGADTDEVRLTASSDHGRADALPLVVRRTDDALHVEVEHGASGVFGRGGLFGRGHGIEFEIEVPRAARVEISTISADLEARGLAGEQVLKTVSGDVEVAAKGGRLAVTTVSGDVDIASSEQTELSVATTSGDVDVAAPELRGVQLRTVSGDAHIGGDFAAGDTHSVETVSGDLTVNTGAGLTIDVKRGLDIAGGGGRRLVAGDGAASLRFRSLSGDVELSGGRREPVRRQAAPPAATAFPVAESHAPDSLEILRALERGEIDVEEASRRLEGARNG